MKSLSAYILFLVGIALAILIPWLSTGTVYWRDSAEFVLAATYLDIPHPPGSPTFGALSNLFTLIPFGPLVWRVHLFGGFLLLTSLWIAWLLANELASLLSQSTTNDSRLRYAFLLATLPVLGSPALLRQTITAEAYLLNETFVLLLILGSTKYFKTHDLRWALSSAFVAGIGLGNHPSIILLVVPLLILVLWSRRLKNALPIVLFGFMGLLIFCYLPIRSNSSPPLNTGAPKTLNNFIQLTTDARDRNLRPVAITSLGKLSNTSIADQIKIFRSEAEKISYEIGWYLPFSAICGTVLLALIAPWQVTTSLLISIGSLLVFFRGWQPDPIIPIWFLASSLSSLTFYSLLVRQSILTSVTVSGVCLLLFALQLSNSTTERTAQLQHTTPQQFVSETLNLLPNNSTFLTESSWFLAKELQTVEGIRPDVTIGYIPQWLFPKYFSPIDLTLQGKPYSSLPAEITDENAPDLRNLGKFLSLTIPHSSLVIEPAIAANEMLTKVGYDSPEGLVHIGKTSAVEATMLPAPMIIEASTELKKLPNSFLQADASSYLESRLIGLSDFLFKQGQIERALKGMSEFCNAPTLRICSTQSYVTIARYLYLAGRSQEAISILEEYLAARGETPLARDTLQALRSASKQ